MFYGLASKYEYFRERLNRFIALQPSYYVTTYTFDFYGSVFQTLQDIGVYFIAGEGWSENYAKICDNSIFLCGLYSWIDETKMDRNAVKAEEYLSQNGIEDRF